MSRAMSLKAKIRNIAKQKKIICLNVCLYASQILNIMNLCLMKFAALCITV